MPGVAVCGIRKYRQILSGSFLRLKTLWNDMCFIIFTSV